MYNNDKHGNICIFPFTNLNLLQLKKYVFKYPTVNSNYCFLQLYFNLARLAFLQIHMPRPEKPVK